MSDQQHNQYGPYDPYQQQHQPQQPYAQSPYDAYASPPGPSVFDESSTQPWEGRTWDDQPQQHQHHHSAYAETAHLPPTHARAQEPDFTYPAPPRPEAARPAAEHLVPPGALPLTPAQRARAEGRSPIIPPGMQPALLTAGMAALLALTAPLARPALAAAVVLLQAVTAAGWYRLNGMWPARQGIALAFAGGVTTDIALLATGREHAPTVALGTLGIWCLLVLILQLRTPSSADERLYALTAGVASTAFTVLAAGHLAASAASEDAVVIGAAAVAVATVTRALRLPPYLSPVLALIAATGAGVAVGGLLGASASGALLGAAAGGCALIGLRVASYDYPSRFVHLTAGVALPLAMAAPAVYILGRAVG
ncbi:hypothetical protein [Streptomyces sp. KR80]|uniref:hypothetical protein n=1 Tax=Streptomyces sp. KR80 TaxID=3457426 RepID=UPI003FD251A3